MLARLLVPLPPITETPQARLVTKRMIFLVVAAASLAAPAAAQSTNDNPPSSAPVATSQASKKLRPGDVIRLRIWREPDMSDDFLVDESGTVAFPKVGEYHVLDDTPATLQARLLADYAKYLRDPSIEVIVLRRVRVTGAVFKPGLQLLDPTNTIADAVAAAGGATPIGDPNHVRIFRDGRMIAVDIREDMRIAESPILSGDQIVVPERSWISRNARSVAALAGVAATLVIALFIRH